MVAIRGGGVMDKSCKGGAVVWSRYPVDARVETQGGHAREQGYLAHETELPIQWYLAHKTAPPFLPRSTTGSQA